MLLVVAVCWTGAVVDEKSGMDGVVQRGIDGVVLLNHVIDDGFWLWQHFRGHHLRGGGRDAWLWSSELWVGKNLKDGLNLLISVNGIDKDKERKRNEHKNDKVCHFCFLSNQKMMKE